MRQQLCRLWALGVVASMSLEPSVVVAGERVEQSKLWVLTGARLDPVWPGAPTSTVTVVVRDGVVECAKSTCRAPAGARVVDGAGWTLVPGFLDAASHIGLMEVALEQSSHDGVLSGTDNAADVFARDGVSMNSRVVKAALRGGVTHALTIPRSAAVVTGHSALIDTSAKVRTSAVKVAAAALHIQIGEGAKTHKGRPQVGARSGQVATLRALMDECFVRFVRPVKKGMTAPPWTLGERSTWAALRALTPALKGERLVAFHANRAADILAAVDLQRRYGLRAMIVGGAEAHVVASRLADARMPVVLTPSRPDRFATLRSRPSAAALLHRAGVKVVLSTGSTFNARNLRWLAGLARRHGLPRDEALRSVSLTPSLLLGLFQKPAMEGRKANFVAFTGDSMGLDGKPRLVAVGASWLFDPTQR